MVLAEGTAAGTDADALFMLADWRLFGLCGAQDHAGLPVRSGVIWLATRRIRAVPYILQ